MEIGRIGYRKCNMPLFTKVSCGELVPQNPDEEPASVFLEYIYGGG